MKFKISKEVFECFQGTVVGVVQAYGLDNTVSVEKIYQLLREAEGAAVEKLSGVQLREHALVVPWREAYKKFGAKPKKHPSSIENILRRIVSGERIRRINPLVDIYNAVSIKYFLPAGGEDLDKIKGDVILTFASNNENSVLLLGDCEEKTPAAGEVIYKDDVGAICRRWNWREAERTKLTENTTNALIVIEGLPPATKDYVLQAANEIASLIKQHCGGTVSVKLMDETLREVEMGAM